MARAQTPTDIIWRALQGSEADRQTRNDRHLAQRLLARFDRTQIAEWPRRESGKAAGACEVPGLNENRAARHEAKRPCTTA